MDYGEVLSKAWKIIWKFKILWLFGIMAGCGSAGGNGGGSSGYRSTFQGNLSPEINQFINNFGYNIQQIPIWVWLLLIIAFIVIFILVIFLNTIGTIGLIEGAKEADQGTASLPFGQLFNASLSFFWRVFLLNLLFGIVVLAVIMVAIVPIFLLTVVTFGLALLCLLPLFCLLVPISWIINIFLEQSIIAMIVEKVGIIDGLVHGWDVVKRNPGQIIIMGLVLLIGGGIIGLIIALPLGLLILPVIISAAFGGHLLSIGVIIAIVLFILYLPFLLLFSGILRAYIDTAWTLTYLRLTSHKMVATPEIMPDTPLPPPDPMSATGL